MAFDPWKWKEYLLQTGDYDGYRKEVSKELSGRPESYYRTQIAYLEGHMEQLIDAFGKLPKEGAHIGYLTWKGHWELACRAQRADWIGYLRFRESYAETMMLNMEAMRRILVPGPSASSAIDADRLIHELLGYLDETLQWYQRSLRYRFGLTLLASNKVAVLTDIEKRDAVSLEQGVEALGGSACILGEEFRHIRNALGHKSVHIRKKEGVIEFRDLNPRTGVTWRKSYESEEFLGLMKRLLCWVMGTGLSDCGEGLLVHRVCLEAIHKARSRNPNSG